MSKKNPMSYFVSEDAKETNKKLKPKSKVKKSVKRDLNKIAVLRDHVQELSDSASLQNLLSGWVEEQSVYDLRVKAGLSAKNYLPELMILRGPGSHTDAAKSIAEFLRKANMTNTNKVCSYDVNDFIQHWVTETRKEITEAFLNSRSAALLFYGFDELIANPRPAIADWYDWVDVIFKELYKAIIDPSNPKKYPVMFSMSAPSRELFLDRFERYRDLRTLDLYCSYAKAEGILNRLMKSIEKDGYTIHSAAVSTMQNVIEKALSLSDIKTVSEYNVRHDLYSKILDNQAKRLREKGLDELTHRQIKTIIKSDIPTQSMIVDNGQVAYF